MPAKSKVSSVERLSSLVQQMDDGLPSEGPRSLCELRLSERDYEVLCQWAQEHLTRGMIRLSGWKAGAIIFHLIAETARREAVGGRLWSVIAGKFSEDLRCYLFPNGQPSNSFKDWIEEASRRLNLRHAFDDDNTKAWYITTHLQHGFTFQDFHRHLPEWLCGQGTHDSIRRLLSGGSSSDSFRDLWQALRFYRRDWITEEHLRGIIKESPWVLPAWEDDLVRLSREKLHLVDFEEGSESDDAPTPNLVEDVQCEWLYGAEPTFKCELADVKPLELFAPHYHLMVGDETKLSLFRQHDEVYRADALAVKFPASSPQAVLKLVDSDGELQHSQLLQLWDSASDINVFELPSGRSVDAVADSMSEAKSYVLVLQPDLRLEPAPETWLRLAGSAPRLAVLLAPPWDHELTRVATADGTTLWAPQIRATALRPSEPQALQHVSVQVPNRERTVAIGESVTPILRGLPANAELVYARYCGKPLSFDPATAQLSKVPITEEGASAGLVFNLGICLDQRSDASDIVLLRRTLDAGVVGTARASVEGWEPIQSRSLITARDCRENSFRVHFPDESGGAKAALMEGPRLLKWLGRRAAPLGRVHGMGAPLVVRSQPYNCDSELLMIARGCTNSGIIERLEVKDDEDSVQIILSRPLDVSADHCVIAWPCGDENEPLLVDSTNIEVSDDRRKWSFVSSSCGVNDRSIVAISFKGRWLGSATAGDPLELLHSLVDFAQNKHLVASLVRWFRLPVLLRDRQQDLPAFADFAHSYPETVLAAWAGQEGLPHSLKHDEGFDRRQIEAIQLRDLFLAWTPNLDQVKAIVEALGTNEHDPLGDVVLQLLVELPLVTGHIMRQWLGDVGTPQNAPLTFYMNVIRTQLNKKLSSGNGTSDGQDEPLIRAANNMNVGPNVCADEFFVKIAIADPAIRTLSGSSLTATERNNLAVGMQLAPFRQYLASRVLDEVERG